VTVIRTAAQLLPEVLLQLLPPIGGAAVAAVRTFRLQTAAQLLRAAVGQQFAGTETGPD
jgi:hypothetical protein